MKKYEDVIDVMQTYGGSFAKALAVAYMYADTQNAKKIENEFSELFLSYKKFLKD